MQPRLKINVNKDPKVSDKIKSIVNAITAGMPMDQVSISAIKFGSGPNDSNDLLTDVSFDINSSIQGIVRQVPLSIPVTLSSIRKRSSSFLSFKLLDLVGIDINSLDINFSPDGNIKAGVPVALALPFPVDLNIPYISFNSRISQNPFANILFGLKFSGLNPSLNLTVDTSIKDSDICRKELANLSLLL